MIAAALLAVAVATIAIFITRPPLGLIVYAIVLVVFPQYVTVSLGTVDLSTGRIVILALILRLISQPIDPGVARLRWLDVLVAVYYVSRLVALSTTESMMTVIEREGGNLFDTVLPYAATRLSIRTRADFYLFVKGLIAAAIPLAFIGVFQTLTGTNPYGFMRAHSAWDLSEQRAEMRMGFYRADASFGNPIPFGLFFAMLIPLHAGMAFMARGRLMPYIVVLGILFAGLLSSMSSAPVFALTGTAMLMASYRLRRFWPYVLAVVVAVCVFVELYSNRHFYHVLTRFAFDTATAYYRIGLVEEAFGGGMSGRWATGWGYVGYGTEMGRNGFNWVHQDITNAYVFVLVTVGLVGVFPYLAMNGYYFWCLGRAFSAVRDFPDKWMIWCIAAGLTGWNAAMMTVAPLGQTNTLIYMTAGMIAASRMVLIGKPAEREAAGDGDDPDPAARAKPVPRPSQPISRILGERWGGHGS